VQLDTDPIQGDFISFSHCLALDYDKLDAIRANPSKFGPEVPVILEMFGSFLDPDDLSNGSRTVRSLTQLAFAFHKQAIQRLLRRSLLSLLQETRVKRVIPCIISSSGGGAGSALQILLLMEFLSPAFRHTLMEGFPPGLLQRPLSFVVEPYALAQNHSDIHHSKILGNAMAFRIESEFLERQGATKYVFHLGLTNRHGTILAEPNQISRVLGTSVYELQRNWSEFKARMVDPLGNSDGYSGGDLPEKVFP
jgi:hypothetical protein